LGKEIVIIHVSEILLLIGMKFNNTIDKKNIVKKNIVLNFLNKWNKTNKKERDKSKKKFK
jgi:hypothetical protein